MKSLLLLSIYLIDVSAIADKRVTRQAVHCQPNDVSCNRCAANCKTISPSYLPECCEAFNACCEDYFQACKVSNFSLQKRNF